MILTICFQKQVMSADFPSLPRMLEQINTINKTKIPWEEFRGKGLPDSSTNAWSVIVNLFHEGGGHRNDQIELDKFFNGIHAGRRTYKTLNSRLRLELKRRGDSDCARINKQQKSMARECAPSTTPALAFEDAAAAEGSSSRSAAAAAAAAATSDDDEGAGGDSAVAVGQDASAAAAGSPTSAAASNR